MEIGIHVAVLGAAFAVALVMGVVMAKTNFCTMGAVSDWVNMQDMGRLRAWLLAVAVAAGALLVLELAGLVTLPPNTQPPYRTPQFSWLRYLVGGFLFGIGMTLASGCGTKTLVRIGGGNLKSLLVAAMIAAVAYAMFTTDLFRVAVLSWSAPTTLDLAAAGVAGQHLDALLASATGLHRGAARLVAGAAIAGLLLYWVLRSQDFRTNRDLVLGGTVVGLAVAVGWLITGGPWGEAWREWALFAEERPSRVEVQSYTFISPIGETGRYLVEPSRWTLLTFGVMAVFGVTAGSFLYAVATRSFRLEWFASRGDFVRHLLGGLLMGFGGFTAMGCTIGQGVTGTSTLALGSFLALAAMIAGAAATMKLQYRLLERGYAWAA